MAVLTIRLIGDPVLKRKAAAVPTVTKRIAKLLQDMEETMYAANGIGLAAPQVGVSLRAIVVDVGEGPVRLINPSIAGSTGSEIDREGCLSIPNVLGYVERPAEVVITGLNERGKPVRIEADGLFARALQHEIDHLDGILLTDRASSIVEITPDDEDDSDGEGADAVSDAREAADSAAVDNRTADGVTVEED